MGTELEDPDEDKFRDSTIAVAMKKVKSKMETAEEEPMHEDMKPMDDVVEGEPTDTPLKGLMARRT